MRIRIIEGVVLPGGIDALPGQIHTVHDRFALQLIHERRAEAASDERPETVIQTRDPESLTRDPKPSKGAKR